MNKLKLIITAIIAALLIGSGITIYTLSVKLRVSEDNYKTAVNNNKAYELENSSLKDRVLQFQFTTEQLNHSKDSLVQKLNETRKDLKIKDKNLREMEYIASQSRKVDSIFVHDTLFRENVVLDTTISDKWARMHLHLSYPNQIVADYSFNNSTQIFTSVTKETVNPPKKCWLGRLFQKKQEVVEVKVIQENPYCEIKEEKHIKVVK